MSDIVIHKGSNRITYNAEYVKSTSDNVRQSGSGRGGVWGVWVCPTMSDTSGPLGWWSALQRKVYHSSVSTTVWYHPLTRERLNNGAHCVVLGGCLCVVRVCAWVRV
jgi:hypothetical protein